MHIIFTISSEIRHCTANTISQEARREQERIADFNHNECFPVMPQANSARKSGNNLETVSLLTFQMSFENQLGTLF